MNIPYTKQFPSASFLRNLSATMLSRTILLILISITIGSKQPLVIQLTKNRVASVLSVESRIVEAASVYKQIFGNLLVPVDFMVPSDSRWPQNIWNFELGSHAQHIRHKRNSASISRNLKESLTEIGFVWDVRSAGFDNVHAALLKYKEIHGDLLVPQNFIVPTGEKSGFPKELWGLNLGKKVKSIRRAEQYYNLNQSSVLDRLGFNWDNYEAKRDRSFNEDLQLLQIFKRLHGHVNVSKNFVVPDNNSLWPSKFSGRSLGAILSRIRKGIQYTDYSQRSAIESLGIQISQPVPREQNFQDVYRALQIYKKIHG